MPSDKGLDKSTPTRADEYRETVPTSPSDIDEARETIDELNEAPRESGDPLIEQSDIVGNPTETRG